MIIVCYNTEMEEKKFKLTLFDCPLHNQDYVTSVMRDVLKFDRKTSDDIFRTVKMFDVAIIYKGTYDEVKKIADMISAYELPEMDHMKGKKTTSLPLVVEISPV